MPKKSAKIKKRNRLLKNEQLRRNGRTPSQIARKKQREVNNG